jgi:hypothetical protein
MKGIADILEKLRRRDFSNGQDRKLNEVVRLRNKVENIMVRSVDELGLELFEEMSGG